MGEEGAGPEGANSLGTTGSLFDAASVVSVPGLPLWSITTEEFAGCEFSGSFAVWV